MLNILGLLLVLASLEIISCQKPPRIPYVYLPGQKFSLPPICSNAAEWQDVALSLKILADITEPKREKSAFTSLINLIKFVLIKEELSCPLIQQMTRSGGKISNAMNTLQNSQIISKIEAALAKKPAKVETVEVNDHIDVPNMIPVLKARGKSRRKLIAKAAEGMNNATTTTESKVIQDGGTSGTPLVAAVSLGSKTPCECSKCTPITLMASLQSQRPNVPCQRLQILSLSPVVMGCSRNCNICQKLSPMAQLQRSSPIVLIRDKMSNPACISENRVKSVLSVMRNETIPLVNCYGNMLNKVTTRILVPYSIVS